MPSGGQREELQPSQTDLSAGSFELTGTSHQCLLYLTFSVFFYHHCFILCKLKKIT